MTQYISIVLLVVCVGMGVDIRLALADDYSDDIFDEFKDSGSFGFYEDDEVYADIMQGPIFFDIDQWYASKHSKVQAELAEVNKFLANTSRLKPLHEQLDAVALNQKNKVNGSALSEADKTRLNKYIDDALNNEKQKVTQVLEVRLPPVAMAARKYLIEHSFVALDALYRWRYKNEGLHPTWGGVDGLRTKFNAYAREYDEKHGSKLRDVQDDLNCTLLQARSFINQELTAKIDSEISAGGSSQQTPATSDDNGSTQIDVGSTDGTSTHVEADTDWFGMSF